MNDREINKIIAEYMGAQVVFDADYFDDFVISQGRKGKTVSSLYTESLDALVPVWEQLDRNILRYIVRTQEGYFYYNGLTFKTLQQAAAHVTAKAIKELEEGDNG